MGLSQNTLKSLIENILESPSENILESPSENIQVGPSENIQGTDFDFLSTGKLCPGWLMYYRGHAVNHDILKTIGEKGAGA